METGVGELTTIKGTLVLVQSRCCPVLLMSPVVPVSKGFQAQVPPEGPREETQRREALCLSVLLQGLCQGTVYSTILYLYCIYTPLYCIYTPLSCIYTVSMLLYGISTPLYGIYYTVAILLYCIDTRLYDIYTLLYCIYTLLYCFYTPLR